MTYRSVESYAGRKLNDLGSSVKNPIRSIKWAYKFSSPAKPLLNIGTLEEQAVFTVDLRKWNKAAC